MFNCMFLVVLADRSEEEKIRIELEESATELRWRREREPVTEGLFFKEEHFNSFIGDRHRSGALRPTREVRSFLTVPSSLHMLYSLSNQRSVPHQQIIQRSAHHALYGTLLFRPTPFSTHS